MLTFVKDEFNGIASYGYKHYTQGIYRNALKRFPYKEAIEYTVRHIYRERGKNDRG